MDGWFARWPCYGNSSDLLYHSCYDWLGATGPVTMAVLALPKMLKRGYEKKIAMGGIFLEVLWGHLFLLGARLRMQDCIFYIQYIVY